jgi:predicted RNA-binding Zn-ribbon protein involved in translation (DUF1610 family)
METSPTKPTHRQFPCKECGANLQFAPGTDSLKCPYCGAMNEIAKSTDTVTEQSFESTLRNSAREVDMQDQITVRCTTCGAETTLAPNITAGKCPFCGGGIVAEGSSKKQIRPKSLLPFKITRDEAGQSYRDWIGSRWFAPSELKRRAEASQITGVYIPCWTYDAQTSSDYTGERGDNYWDTETYTTLENNQQVTRTRQVQKIRWWPASGRVNESFDDVLVLASRSLPECAQALDPWDLPALVPYRDEYLSGFIAESYQIGLPEGFEIAKQIMAGPIHQSVEQDIGGDHQRVSSIDTTYSDVTYKHALLPVWISAYRYAGTTYRFLINARTGEVQGDRPYSWVKITFTVIAIVAVIAMVLLALQR